jgi:hypothetical protein
LARAKNTQRAQARRRHREQVRVNELSDGVEPNDVDDGPDAVTGQDTAPAAPRGLGSLFTRPHLRDDIRALPGLFRTKKLLWLPFAILIIAALMIGALQVGVLPVDTTSVVAIVASLVLQPSALFVPFIAGFLAPRASYLIGFLVGLVQAILFSIVVIAPASNGGGVVPPSTTSPSPATDLPSSIMSVFVVCLIFGTVAAAFASWYRGFLRNSQMRAQQNRIAREKQAREKAKEREREQRIADRESRKSSPRKVAP